MSWPKPMQAHRDSALYRELSSSPAWACEPKKNGYRAIASEGSITSRNGVRLAPWPYPVVCDGEWMGPRTGEAGAFCAFDLLSWGGRDFRGMPYGRRRMLLEEAARELGFPVVPLLSGPDPLPGALERGEEGVVFKRLDKAYPRDATTPWWVKVKS